MTPQFDLTYLGGESEQLRFDRYHPHTEGKLPAIICIHGGGWISGDKSMMSDVAASLTEHGYAAFCPEYRLAPLHPYPAAIEDLQAFVRHLRQHADELNIDPNAIGAIGNSAGGHLASMLGLTNAEVDGVSSRVQSVVDICGISDLTAPGDNHFPVSQGFLEQFMGKAYSGNESDWANASPTTHVCPHAPPFLIAHGEADDIVPIAQSETLAGRLFAHGVPVDFHRLPGEGHSFTYSGWTRLESLFTEFFARTLKHELPV